MFVEKSNKSTALSVVDTEVMPVSDTCKDTHSGVYTLYFAGRRPVSIGNTTRIINGVPVQQVSCIASSLKDSTFTVETRYVSLAGEEVVNCNAYITSTLKKIVRDDGATVCFNELLR